MLHKNFGENGYLVVNDLLDPVEDLQPLIEDYTQLLDSYANEWYDAGKIPSTFADLPFQHRLSAVLSQSSENLFKYFDISFAHGDITADSPIHLSEPVFSLLTHPRILDVVETLIGGEITCNPIQHVRIKPPEREVVHNPNQSSLVIRSGWHQDQGTARPESDETEIITVWVAITDADEENGCLCVVPGSHRQGLTLHCPADGVTIPDSLIEENITPIPVRRGGALFMHRMTKHASLPNVSDRLRWSFDLRYQPTGQPTGREEFPSIVVRSRSNPDAVVSDYRDWKQLWLDARDRLVDAERLKTHRWNGDAEPCA